MNIKIKLTTPRDFLDTEILTREAFWNLYSPGCNEHLILHQLRESASYIPELDLIAVSSGKLVGHVISTKAAIIGRSKSSHEILCVGPISVLPELQHQGIGSELLKRSIIIARKMKYSGMILFGSPAYYSRFGFVNAKKFGITTREGKNLDPFMVLELTAESLTEVNGKFFEDAAFMVDDNALIRFEKNFPVKKKGKTKIDLSAYNE